MYITPYLYIEMIMGVKMPKIPLNITVDKDILDKFKEVCDKSDIKISTKINTLMKEWVENNGKN